MAVRTYQIGGRDSRVTREGPARSYLWRAGTRAGEGMRVRVIVNWGIAAIMGVLTCMAPMILGWWYAVRPSERLLVMLRPLTIAAVFAALSNTTLAFVNTLVWISRRPGPVEMNIVAIQLAETLAIPFVSFGFLAAAWLGVAVGMRKQA
jgi:hypothetical protein